MPQEQDHAPGTRSRPRNKITPQEQAPGTNLFTVTETDDPGRDQIRRPNKEQGWDSIASNKYGGCWLGAFIHIAYMSWKVRERSGKVRAGHVKSGKVRLA